MAKKNQNKTEVEETQNKVETPAEVETPIVAEKAEEITTPEITTPEEKDEEEIKAEATTEKKYFDEHFNRKFYLKGKNQIEVNGKIVDKDTLKECPYYENLNEMEIQKFKDLDKII